MLGLTGCLSQAGAVFTAATANSADTMAAAGVAAPTGFSASKVCTPQTSTGSTPTYQSASSATGSISSGTTTVSVTKPTGTASGDLLVAQFAMPNEAGIVDWSTIPSGWGLARDDSMYNSPGHSYLLYHVAGGSEPSSYSFALWVNSGGPYAYAAAIMRFSGVDTRNPFDAYAGTVGTSNTSVVAPGVTTVSNNALLVSFVMVNAQTSFTAPAGMTERYDFQAGSTVTVEAATQGFATAGATGTRTATAGSSGVYAAELVALRPTAVHPAPLEYSVYGNRTTNGASISLPQPSGLAAGDLLVIGATWSGGTANAPSTPTGWTKLRTDSNGSTLSAGWWYRVATGSESWPLSFGAAPASGVLVGDLTAITNVNTANPVSGSAVDNTHTGTSPTAPSITAGDSHTTAIYVFGSTDTTLITAGAGSSWDYYNGSSYNSTYLYSGLSHDIATSTTTGTPSWSSIHSAPWIAEAVAINPPPDAYTITANLSWTASSTSWATGYTWERWTGSLQQTGSASGASTTTATDTDSLTSGTTYTYKLRTDANSWYSGQTTTTLTPTCP